MITSHFIAALLLFGFPIWDFWEAKQLRDSTHPQIKIFCYLRAIAVLWIVTLGINYFMPIRGLIGAPLATNSFIPRMPPDMAMGFLIPLLLGVVFPPLLALAHRGMRKKLLAPYEKLAYLLPERPIEMVLFSGVAISAGICEEVIFRGFLLRYLQSVPWGLPLEWGLLASSAIFGLAHFGQGLKGMLLTGFIGFLLGSLYLASGSLLLPILVHTVIDLRALAMSALRKLPYSASA